MAKNKKKTTKTTTRKEMDMIKSNTIKRYVKDILRFKISKTSTNDIRIRFNALAKDTLREAKRLAQEDKRATIMPRDTDPAAEKIVGRKNLSPADLMNELKQLSASDLVDLGALVEKHITKQKAKGKGSK